MEVPYCKVTRLLALASMPLTAFMFIASSPIIFILLGPNWSGITPIFSVLATVAFAQPVVTLWGMVALSLGMGRRYLQLGIFNTTCSAIGFMCGLPWGPVGVACGYAVVTYATALPMLWWTFRGTPLSVRDFIGAVARPFTASVCAAVITYSVMRITALLNPFEQIAISGILFAVLFMTFLACLPDGRSDIRLIRSLIDPFIRRLLFRQRSFPRSL